MKKVIFAFAFVIASSLAFISCKSKEKCDAYKSCAPTHHKAVHV